MQHRNQGIMSEMIPIVDIRNSNFYAGFEKKKCRYFNFTSCHIFHFATKVKKDKLLPQKIVLKAEN